jgi:hypothetical protein
MALIFTILMFASFNEQQFIFGMLAFICWFISAAFIVFIEIPYVAVYENSLDLGTHVVVEGMHEITSVAPLRFLFNGMGFICLGYSIIMAIWNFFRPLHPGDEEGEE